jgi:hypothetical protein
MEIIKPSTQSRKVAWNDLDDISNISGMTMYEVNSIRSYLKTIPENLKSRLLKKFQTQSDIDTLKDLETIRDLKRINGTCK